MDTITLTKNNIKQKGGMVLMDTAQYLMLLRELNGYRKKERTIRSVRQFQNLASWGREFARARGIAETDIVADD